MSWTLPKDIMLLREVLVIEPYKFKESTRERGKAWQDIANNLHDIKDFGNVRARGVRERFQRLEEKFKQRERQEHKATGIAPPELDEWEVLMEEIISRMKECDINLNNEAKQKSKKVESDKAGGEDMRAKTMESLGETMKRKAEEISPSSSKKSRSTGSETIQFLREKMQQDMDLKKEEIDLKRNEQKQQNAMFNQMQQMQQNFLQQNQAQTQLLIGLLHKLSDK